MRCRRVPLAVFFAVGVAVGLAAPAEVRGGDRGLIQELEPAPLLAPRGVRDGEVVPHRVRFYAVGDYRRGRGRWQERVRGMLASVNAFLEPGFRVRLEGVEWKRWDRASGSAKLHTMME